MSEEMGHVDDETFAKLLGPIDEPATDGASAADETAIEAAVPDETDVPEASDEQEDPDAIAAEDGEEEEESDEETEVEEAEVIPIHDPRHPDHGWFVEAQTARQAREQAQRVIAEAARIRHATEITNTLKGLPDTDPDQLVPTVTGLIARVMAPVRQQVADANQAGEEAAKVATTFHLAMHSVLSPEQIAAVESEAKVLAQHPNWEAMRQVVATKHANAYQESQTVTNLKAQVALLTKQVKARLRPPEADVVGGVGANGVLNVSAPVEGESKFDKWFNETQVGHR